MCLGSPWSPKCLKGVFSRPKRRSYLNSSCLGGPTSQDLGTFVCCPNKEKHFFCFVSFLASLFAINSLRGETLPNFDRFEFFMEYALKRGGVKCSCNAHGDIHAEKYIYIKIAHLKEHSCCMDIARTHKYPSSVYLFIFLLNG